MKKVVFALSVFLGIVVESYSQSPEQINILSVTPSVNTGMNYGGWMNNNMSDMVANVWSNNNNQYIDVKLKLQSQANITKISLYDYQGIFTWAPASIYAVTGSQQTLLGTFTGESYMSWIDINVPVPVLADTIIVKKYGNNIPVKLKVFGVPVNGNNNNNGNNNDPDPGRVYVTSVTPYTNTGMNYAAWMNDNMNQLVTNVWSPSNFQYVDVGLKLEHTADITKISLFDFEGVFTSLPAYVYAATGNQRTLLGMFTGLSYNQWVNILPSTPILADSIIVRKWGNNIPMKIKVYGLADTLPDMEQLAAGQIPIDAKRWYQLNNTSNGLEGLFDGVTNVEVETGWGKILSNYDAYYEVLPGEVIHIDSIKFFDWQGNNTNAPFTVSIINSLWQRIPIATFTGIHYNEWVGPNPSTPLNALNRFALPVPMTDVKYILINTSGAYPTEMKLYGAYTPPTALPPMEPKTIKLKQMLGINAFEWDFVNPGDPLVIDEARMNAMKSFRGIRHYMDWERIELAEGSYTFNPCHSGGWNYDTIYARCKEEGIEVLADLKTIPGWMKDTYPLNMQDDENIPVKYNMDYSNPLSYIEQAKVGFQFAARYGYNTNVNTNLLSVNPLPRWNNDPMNVVKKGLGLIKYIECDNERDKWWKERKAYQSGREYAANLSAFYDGHKNTMGLGVGVKNADPGMQVVMGGVAATTTDYVRGMIDWCKEFRGYKLDGSVDLCWDVINYHVYANDAQNSQLGTSSRGAAPEVALCDTVAQEFIDMAHRYAADMPVWVTETGYDIHQGSSLKAIPIGNKTALQTQADWILRTALLYARMGIERCFFYQTYDENILNPGKFASSGLLNANMTRKPAADFLLQANRLLGDYTYVSTISHSPIVDKYTLNGNTAYALTKPTENGSTASYNLNVGNVSTARIYTPVIGQDSMSVQTVNVTNGNLALTVSETPMFVLPGLSINTMRLANGDGAANSGNQLLRSVTIYPNPTNDYVDLSIDNDKDEIVEVKVYDAVGSMQTKMTLEKNEQNFIRRIDLSYLSAGVYVIDVQQGEQKVSKRVVKLNTSN